MKRYPTTLIIAGSDSGGGAGIQADIKTCSALGVYASTAITAITAQNTQGVRNIMPVTPEIVRQQIEAVIDDLTIDSIKIGMLCNASIATAVADAVSQYDIPIILDPVMVSTSGHKLLSDDAIDIIIHRLFSIAEVVTPNIHEASLLSGMPIDNTTHLDAIAMKILSYGCKSVLIKGGHLAGDMAVDCLHTRDGMKYAYSLPYIDTRNTHGTGCTLSSAIASFVALGYSLHHAVECAKNYLWKGIDHGAHIFAGKGNGAINHGFAPQPLKTIEYQSSNTYTL